MKSFVLFLSLFFTFHSYAEAKKNRLPRQEAEYTVPVADQNLAEFSKYKFDVKWLVLTEGRRAFKYDLPDELDGVGQDILLQETSPGIFSGPKADATCSEIEIFECRIKYHNLVIDHFAAESIINTRYAASSPELNSRLEISKLFRFDPETGGVLKVVAP